MTTTLARINLGEAFKLKNNEGISNIEAFSDVRSFVSSILPNVFVIAGLILLGLIVAGGIGFITSAGNPEAQQKSKGTITNAVLGFVIIFAAYWLIQIIQIITGIDIIGK
jgi:sterol desaturase/sphingolipid hydroxylase (fatty acid hydroxylase superfamily)